MSIAMRFHPICSSRSFVSVMFMVCFAALVDSFLLPRQHQPIPRRSSSPIFVSFSSQPPPRSKASADPPVKTSSANDASTYVQWNRQRDLWKLQTAVTTFRRPSDQKVVELHAQQHYGDASYFQFWNSGERFLNNHDAVLFELLVDDNLLKYDSRTGDWRVTQSIMASTNDQNFAQNLGLACQASVIDYTRSPKWSHADLSRQEFQQKVATVAPDVNQDESTPLWKLASPDSSSTAAEAVAALMVGPPSLEFSTNGAGRKRRLFTNLFLPGGRLASSIRGILWMTVPSPELSIILLDWSSLLQKTTNVSALSQVALPILNALVRFDIPQMRRFLFGQQLILSSQTNGNQAASNSSWSLLVLDRNDHALKVLDRKLGDPEVRSVALLYGSSHCPDLHQKLVQMGFQPQDKQWRTAWSVQETTPVEIPTEKAHNNTLKQPSPNLGLGGLLVFYLIVGALDWVGIVGDTSSLLLESNYLDAGVEVGLYLLRHVLLYLGLSKFLVDWTNTANASR